MDGTLDACFILGLNKALSKVPANASFLNKNGQHKGFVLAVSDEGQAEYILTSTSIKTYRQESLRDWGRKAGLLEKSDVLI